MDKKPNKIHENLIPQKLHNNHTLYSINSYKTVSRNIPYNYPVLLAALCFNSGYMSSYALIIRY